MIRSFRSKELQEFFERDRRQIPRIGDAENAEMILDLLDAAVEPNSLKIPGYRFWEIFECDGTIPFGVGISGRLRITYKWQYGGAFDVDLEEF